MMKHPLEITSPLYAFLSSQRPITAELRQESLRIKLAPNMLLYRHGEVRTIHVKP